MAHRDRPSPSGKDWDGFSGLASDRVSDPSVDVVLPCLNEAAALPWVLDRMPAGWRPIVADNGSTDCSAQVARDRGALVVAGDQHQSGCVAIEAVNGLEAKRMADELNLSDKDQYAFCWITDTSSLTKTPILSAVMVV